MAYVGTGIQPAINAGRLVHRLSSVVIRLILVTLRHLLALPVLKLS